LSRAFRVYIATLILALSVDQLVKLLVRSSIVEAHSTSSPWPGVFEITLSYNKGVAFGMLQGFGVYMAPIAIAIAIATGYYSYRNAKESMWVHVALSLIASGAVGNLYDRLVFGQVTDMFWFRLINFPVFNVADSCITVGTAILVIRSLWEVVRGTPEKALEKQQNEAAKQD
jgi:signal peptidase II